MSVSVTPLPKDDVIELTIFDVLNKCNVLKSFAEKLVAMFDVEVKVSVIPLLNAEVIDVVILEADTSVCVIPLVKELVIEVTISTADTSASVTPLLNDEVIETTIVDVLFKCNVLKSFAEKLVAILDVEVNASVIPLDNALVVAILMTAVESS